MTSLNPFRMIREVRATGTPRLPHPGTARHKLRAGEFASLCIALRQGVPENRFMSIEEKIVELGLSLPSTPPPAGNYLPSVQSGRLLHLSGVICSIDGRMTHTGPVGSTRDVEYGYQAARVCVLNALANTKAALGSLERISRVVYVGGFVNAAAGFSESSAVINGASDLLVDILGEPGRHARAAVAVAGLPKDTTVELQIVIEVRD